MDRKLRSSELKLSFGLEGTDAAWETAVTEVVAQRSQWTSKMSSGGDALNAAGGRLLLYDPKDNLACGAAEFSSNRFFAVNNVPPWDIWVDFSEGTLVSWVPPAFVDLAQMGIDVNPEQCIRWAGLVASRS